MQKILITLLLFFSVPVLGEMSNCYESDLMRDLMIVDQVNQALFDRMPVYYNHLLYGGYFNMPSARMGPEGDCGAGFSYVPPYNNYNLRFQFLPRVEISGNYRVFCGVDDPLLSRTGFGDLSDKGANIKWAFWLPEDSNYMIPGLAVGWEDFIGTSAFEAHYAVLTQVVPCWNLEASLGYGDMRLNGWFGGLMWVPFRCCGNPYFKDIALVVEYDAISYKSPRWEPHPDGRSTKSPINYGLKYRLWDMVDFSASYIRGEKFACSAAFFYNLGMTEGIMPKVDDPLPYRSPINTQCIGPLRPEDVFAQELALSFRFQGFDLMEAWLSCDKYGSSILRLKLLNCMWRYERDVRHRLNDLLAGLIPSNIDHVVITLEDAGVPIQEYHFQMRFVRLYAEQKVCPYELFVLSPLCEAGCAASSSRLLFLNKLPWFDWAIYPSNYMAFGSSTGKFKYTLGAQVTLWGSLWNGWYYNSSFNYNFYCDLYTVKDVDKLNPSQIINVRTDSVNYYKQDGFQVDYFYLQKNWNIGRGFYTSLAGGLFERAYGGVAGQLLWYPVCSNLAVGVEGAYLKKRDYKGFGFTDSIRKLEGYQPTWKKYHGNQYFANLYYHFEEMNIDMAFKAGRFLAHDWGIRTELSKYYPSGLRLFMWYTHTDAKDYVNGNRYQDKGVGISVPVDIFLPHSSRKRLGYAMSAWLRDVGAIANTGDLLFYTIREERETRIK